MLQGIPQALEKLELTAYCEGGKQHRAGKDKG